VKTKGNRKEAEIRKKRKVQNGEGPAKGVGTSPGKLGHKKKIKM